MIEVKNLSHSYTNDDKKAIEDISFKVKKGEIFGFLGPSGAGKSTTQGVLTGLLKKQVGVATVAGFDVSKMDKAMFNKIGVSFEQSNVYSKLTAKENLEFYSKLFDVETKDANELLKLVGLEGKENDRAGSFSKGMKHRLTFARSMINNPEIWFLDEPTTGLDPAIAAKIKSIIKEEKEKGTTIFLTTHNMHIAEELCDRVAFIVDGKITVIDSPKNLKMKYGENTAVVEYKEDKTTKQKEFNTKEGKKELSLFIDNNDIETIHTKEATLEEIFIKITGKELI